MIMADEHSVDTRQILPGYSRFSPAPRTDPGQRTCSFGPNWVRQNVGTPLLKEHGRVVHQSGSQVAAFHTAGRYGWLDVRYETGRRFRPAGQLPSEGLKRPGCLRSIRIVEALSIKVLRKSRAARTSRMNTIHVKRQWGMIRDSLVKSQAGGARYLTLQTQTTRALRLPPRTAFRGLEN
jgi:hypothetical protein